MQVIVNSRLLILICLFALGCDSGPRMPVDMRSVASEARSSGPIDTKLAMETIESLGRLKGKERAEVVDRIMAAPENYAPPVLYTLSAVLFEEGRKDEAMFWYYSGQLRGRIDAQICADQSARQAMGVLNSQFGTPINEYAFLDTKKLTDTVEKVLKWEEVTACNYDRRWINLHGMGAFAGDSNKPLSAPKNEWETIRKTTRDTYRSTFYQMLKEMKNTQP